MRVAYLITAYDDVKLLNILIKILTERKRYVFIHYDAKHSSDVKNIYTNEYVAIIKNSLSVEWGSYALTEAMIRLIEAAQSFSAFEYFHVISGSDLPVRPINEFESYLEEIYPKDILAACALDRNNFQQKKRLYSRYVINNRNFYNNLVQKIYFFIGTYISHRQILPNVDFYFGNSWITVTHDTATWLVKKWRDPIINDFFKETFCPDEIFFPTYINAFNNGASAHFYDVRYTVWNGQPRPKYLTIEDLPAIRASHKYFARKFQSELSKELIDIIINCDLQCT